jgi:hypothetical protein
VCHLREFLSFPNFSEILHLCSFSPTKYYVSSLCNF